MSAGGAIGRLAAVHAGRRYVVLFYTLLMTLVAGPLLTTLGLSSDLLHMFLAFSLLVALLGVPSQRWRLFLMLAAAVVLGLRIMPASAIGSGTATSALMAISLLALLEAAGAVRFAMRARVIDAQPIYAALCAYLLAGLFFGVLHWAVEEAWPGSFEDTGATTPGTFTLPAAIYFSFVTLATLGYGDVVPRSELARGIAVLEAIGGQLYVAVMIARLVGAQLQGGFPGGPTKSG